ncbi:MAG TPA: VWA domain-containing protein [Chitinophagales bacterium]|nr:VWA domain-containing protein [Chitinophagales bacterium]HRP39853.1 VWA domain-containing protein [Chitinophagales bacterium]
MFRFERPELLYLLLLLIPFAVAYTLFLLWRKKKTAALGEVYLITQLMPLASTKKLTIKFIVWSFAWLFLVLGLANPQIGSKMEKVQRKGIDVMIALDVSNSMLAEDIKPNRLLRAKNFISSFIEQLNNDRLGLIVFAGKAYLQMPLTVDYSAAKLYLNNISTGMIPTQGTDIAEAVNLARQSFVKGETKHKALLIITDGEDNEGGAEDAIKQAADEGIKTFILGIGTEKGAPIPVSNSDFKRDENGAIVLTKANFGMMKDLASYGKGKAYLIGNSNNAIQEILTELGTISTKKFEEYVFTDFNNQFQWGLGIAALLLFLEMLLNERKINWRLKW